MERRDKWILWLLLAGAGYAGYQNWEVISTTLGLDDISPGRVKAIDLAQREYSFERGRTNSMVLRGRAAAGEIEFGENAWQAKRLKGDVFRVVFTFRERGEERCFEFDVDISIGRVTSVE